MVSLESINLMLDIFLKVVLTVILIFVFLMMRNLDKAVSSLERSAESVERSVDTVEDVVRIARMLPFVGGGKE